MPYNLQIFRENQSVFVAEFDGIIEIGRGETTEPLFSFEARQDKTSRIAIAPNSENRVGRKQLQIRPHNGAQICLKNLSGTVALDVGGHTQLAPSATQTVTLPVTVLFPAKLAITIDIEPTSVSLDSLDEATLVPGQSTEKLLLLPQGREAENLVLALQATMDVFQIAKNSVELFSTAISNAIRLAAFDRSQVLFYENGAWKPETSISTQSSWVISQTVLGHVARQKRTFWESDVSSSFDAASLSEVDAVIAAPILSPKGSVLGALYCDRRQQPGSSDRKITRLDARLVELLACGIASGLARIEQEETARRMTSQFEQFFIPELTRELERNPTLLDGRDADVSILFCDIRGFSRISERIGAQGTFEWINDVMGTLSECVTRHQGVLVDYIGDELMAMWGAPQPQESHAKFACRAALDMLKVLPCLNSRWEPVVGETMDLGIGINSGPVRAGNAGSKKKFKYSPLGNTVNLASRVQGATKYLKTRFLVTGETADQLGRDFLRRRLASVRVVNIQEPVSLWELTTSVHNDNSELFESYQQALAAFDHQEFREAARTLAEILGRHPSDGPSLVLLKRTVNAMVDGPEIEHPVWEFDRK